MWGVVMFAVTSLTRNGLRDWIIQQVSAFLMSLYAGFILIYYCVHPQAGFQEWHTLMSSPWMRLWTFLIFFSLILHAWIGLWTVTTDYLKCKYGRAFFQLVIFLLLFSYFIVAITLLWRV